jgi:hypothetical protein
MDVHIRRPIPLARVLRALPLIATAIYLPAAKLVVKQVVRWSCNLLCLAFAKRICTEMTAEDQLKQSRYDNAWQFSLFCRFHWSPFWKHASSWSLGWICNIAVVGLLSGHDCFVAMAGFFRLRKSPCCSMPSSPRWSSSIG